jgi:hypothetical protein
MKIAILGWGSLLWDKRPEFDDQHGEWLEDGPTLKVEFSRVSKTRHGALTLVLDSENGRDCKVSYTFSRRKIPEDAICDLRCREGTILKCIGFCYADNSRENTQNEDALKEIKCWMSEKKINVVVWTDLKSNFEEKSNCKQPFSIASAISHIQSLDNEGRVNAAEYVWRAPNFIVTPLREELQSEPWFQKVIK